MRMTLLILFIIITFMGPLWILYSGQIDFDADWRTANRASANIAPDPKQMRDAIIQVYSARAFNWRGLFAVHTWIAIKPKDAAAYTVYQVVGWRTFYGLPPLMMEQDLPDRYWFGQKPHLIYEVRGDIAAQLIPKIAAAAKTYPYPDRYDFWPGPNSNTFPAYIFRQVPELGVALPATAIGKDFLPNFAIFARAPSGTGYQISLLGAIGIILAKREGLELNLFGLVYGINPLNISITLPGVGELSLLPTKGQMTRPAARKP